jgi:hypothetical protein
MAFPKDYPNFFMVQAMLKILALAFFVQFALL